MRRVDDDTPPASPGLQIRHGADTYGETLAIAGGSELAARLHTHAQPAIGVGLYRSPPYDLAVPALPVARLSITLTAAQVVGGFDGDRVRTFETGRHALFLAPAGASARWRKEAPSRHLNIYFQPHEFGGDDPDAPALVAASTPLLNASIPGVGALADALALELERGAAALSVEAVDCLGRLLLVRLARHTLQRRDTANPLTPALVARLRDHVEAHLGERILVADMARVVGLSPNRFAQAWSERTGQPPHRFVVEARLTRAQELLQRSTLGIAEIAAACGFATQQHLTQAMRQHRGITPGRLRAATKRDTAER